MITIDGMVVDVARSIEYRLDSDASEHPVDDGADFTDHVRNLPIEVSIDGIMSDVPVASGRVTPAEAASRMREIRAARRPITVVTPRRSLDDMVLVSLSETESARTGDSYQFKATFRQLIIVSNRRTTVRVSIPRARNKTNRGQKTLEEVGQNIFASASFVAGSGNSIVPAPPAKAKTNARKLINAGGGNDRTPIRSGGSAKTSRLPIRSGGGSTSGRTLISAGGSGA